MRRDRTTPLSMWPGVSVGHVDIRTSDLYTGLTAIVPYPASVDERKLFIGRFSIDGGDAMSGLGVAEDFGTFSSPIVLGPDLGRWPGIRSLNSPQLGPRHWTVYRSWLAAGSRGELTTRLSTTPRSCARF